MIWCIMDPKSEFPGGILRFGEYDIKSQHGEIKKKKHRFCTFWIVQSLQTKLCRSHLALYTTDESDYEITILKLQCSCDPQRHYL